MDLNAALAEGDIDAFNEGREGGRFIAHVSKGSKTGSGTGDTPGEAAEAAVKDLSSGGKAKEAPKAE